MSRFVAALRHPLTLGLIGLLLDKLMRGLEGMKVVRWRYAR